MPLNVFTLESLCYGDAKTLSWQYVIQNIVESRFNATHAQNLADWLDGYADEAHLIETERFMGLIARKRDIVIERLQAANDNEPAGEERPAHIIRAVRYWDNWHRQIEINAGKAGHLEMILAQHGGTI